LLSLQRTCAVLPPVATITLLPALPVATEPETKAAFGNCTVRVSALTRATIVRVLLPIWPCARIHRRPSGLPEGPLASQPGWLAVAESL
jgi:hypothetical protein